MTAYRSRLVGRLLVAASPASAYRGLVFETVLYVAFDGGCDYVAPGASVLGLPGWLAAGLALTAAGVRRRD